MTDEAAFLAVLAATPTDDTARLVYADWLDDRDRRAEAEYLRLTAALAGPSGDCVSERPAVPRLLAIAPTLPTQWRSAVAGRFQVAFYGQPDIGHKIHAIKAIREVTLAGLGEAKDWCEQPPSVLHTGVAAEYGSEPFANFGRCQE